MRKNSSKHSFRPPRNVPGSHMSACTGAQRCELPPGRVSNAQTESIPDFYCPTDAVFNHFLVFLHHVTVLRSSNKSHMIPFFWKSFPM